MLPCSVVLRGLHLFAFLCLGLSAAQAHPALQSGPMVGYSEMREALLWAQTTKAARIQFEYWDESDPEVRHRTAPFLTEAATAYTARVIADAVTPGRTYQYQLLIDDERVERPYPTFFRTQAPWRWQTEEATATIALGSCSYISEAEYDRPGRPPGDDYMIFTSIAAARPDAMLWLGDNVYLREPDWNSRTGILRRYTHTRTLPELQPLLASVHHYAIWDDHDFGPNNSDRGFWNKNAALDAFKLFWGNPGYGIDERPGTTGTFEWDDAQFFLLDNRYYRTPNERRTGERSILGAEQREWLLDALVSSRARFKIVAVGGQFLNPVAVGETWSTFPEERAALLQAFEDEQIEGLLFLSGDRHATELARLERPGSYPLYDLTVSPLTSGVSGGIAKEENTLRVPETLVTQRNFALLNFSGPANNRLLSISVRDTTGTELWSRQIAANELRIPKAE